MKKKLKICFCTVVKNRLHHLKVTLIKNLESNLDYEQLQFLILDYNSDDGVDEWVRVNMEQYLLNGKLVFYKTSEPAFFHRSHSRNMAMLLSNSDIVCNIDADNFTGPSFANYINDSFQTNPNIFLSTYSKERNNKADVLGRICIRMKDFQLINGYDESMEHYGFEDYDLINRLEHLGLRKVLIEDPEFLNVIKHSDYERISEEKIMKLFNGLYVRYISAAKSEVMIFLKNKVCIIGKIIDCESFYSEDPINAFIDSKYEYEYTLDNKKWEEGEWMETNEILQINTRLKVITFKKRKNNSLKFSNKIFYSITDSSLIIEIILFYSQFLNRNRMKLITTKEKNEKSFSGQGNGVKNFDKTIIL